MGVEGLRGWGLSCTSRRTEAHLVALLLALSGLPALAQDGPAVVPPGLAPAPERIYPVAPVRAVVPLADPFEWSPRPPVLQGELQGHVELRLRVPPGFTVYRDQLAVQVVDPGGLQVGEPDIPPGVFRHDPAKDVESREQYDTDVVVLIPVRTTARSARGLETFEVMVRHQGCIQGHCFAPVERRLQVHVPVRGAEAQDAEPAAVEPPGHGSPGDPLPIPSFVVYVHGSPGSW
jgi:hypothetical protein